MPKAPHHNKRKSDQQSVFKAMLMSPWVGVVITALMSLWLHQCNADGQKSLWYYTQSLHKESGLPPVDFVKP